MSDDHLNAAWGAGLATISDVGDRVLDTYFPSPRLGPPPPGAAPGTAEIDAHAAANLQVHALAEAAGHDELRRARLVTVLTVIPDLGAPPSGAHDAYLRLHLLSHRLAAPRGLNMDGIFGVLSNVVWTSAGPCDPDEFEATRMRFLACGRRLQVTGVDKFPRMTDYVIPSGVRIADADRVRLGATSRTARRSCTRGS